MSEAADNPIAPTGLLGHVGSADVGTVTPAATRALLNVADGATANAADAALRDRATHTGTQAISTVTGLDVALADKAATTHTHVESDVINLVTDLAAKAPLASPTFTGTPAAPTPASSDSSTRLATTAMVQAVAAASGGGGGVAGYVDAAATYGVVADGVEIAGAGAITSGTPTLVVTGASFVAGDVGKPIHVHGAVAGGETLATTIASRTNATTVVLAANATATVSGAKVSYGTDNSTALMAMRTALAGYGKPHYTIRMPTGGIIRYENNKWIVNVKAVTLDAYGCVFQCTHTAAGNHVTISNPLAAPDPWVTNPDTYTGTWLYTSECYLFNDVAAGSQTIRLTTTADAVSVTVGDRVFLYFFDFQFYGAPPCCRYFEWNKVTAVNTGNGDITLEMKTRYRYYNAVKDDISVNPIRGKPRMLVLDRADYVYPELIEILGATFLMNPMATFTDQPNVIQMPANKLILKDVVSPRQVSPGCTQFFEADNCTIPESSIDKLVDVAHYKKCRFIAPLTEGNAVNTVIFEDCDFAKSVNIAPRRLIMKRNRITWQDGNGFIRGATNVATKLWDLEDNELIGGQPTDSYTCSPSAGIASLTVTSFSGGAIFTTANAPVSGIMEGTMIYKGDLSKYGVVTKIEWDGSSWKFFGQWKGTPAASEVYWYSPVQQVRERGTRAYWNAPSISSLQHFAAAGVRTVILDRHRFSAGSQTIAANCAITAIRVLCSAIYTGPDATPQMFVNLTPIGGSESTYITIWLKDPNFMPGYFESSVPYGGAADPAGTIQSHSSATIIPLPVLNHFTTMSLLYRMGGSPIAGTDDQMPGVVIEVDILPLMPSFQIGSG